MKLTKKILALMCALITMISIESIGIIPVQAAVNTELTTVAKNEEELPDGYILSLPDTEDAEVGKVGEVGKIGEVSSNTLQSDSISYNYLGKRRYFGSIRYYDYFSYKNSSHWYVMTGKNLTDIIYHKNGSGKKNLTFTKSQVYSSQTASNFSTSLGADAGVADMVKANVALGAGITKTCGKSYQVSSSIQAEIPKSAKTGYYKMQICYNFYRTKVTQKRTDGSHKITKYISMPYGESYAAVLYSKTNANGSWSRW